MPAELSESEARALLARAAATVEVETGPPLTLTGLSGPPRRHWPVLVAVAAAVVVVAALATYVGARHHDGLPQPIAPAPVETAHRISRGQMPAVIGMPLAQARRVLEARGVRVRAAYDNDTCAPRSTVMAASRAAGAPLARGDTVRLGLADPGRLDGGPFTVPCRSERAASLWGLVRFAVYEGPAPRFAQEVELGVPGRSVRLTAARAARRSGWQLCQRSGCHSALGAIAEMVTRPWAGPVVRDGGYRSTYLDIWPAYLSARGQARCPGIGDLGGAAHSVYLVQLTTPDLNAEDCAQPPLLTVRLDAKGAIAAVDLILPASAQQVAQQEASAAADLARSVTASRFVAWMRGRGPAPRFATSVRLLRFDRVALTMSGDEAGSSTGGGCWGAPTSGPNCVKVDPATILRRAPAAVAQISTRATMCVRPEGELPSDLRAAVGTDLVRLDQPEPRDCRDAYAIELWIDDDGAIYAVNVVAAPRHT